MTVQLQDTERGVSYPRPRLRGWQHAVWFVASIAAGTVLIVRADGARATLAASVYAGSLVALFGVSALYHRGRWGPLWSRRLQRLDTAMILVLIAGSASPIVLLELRGRVGVACFVALWTLTLGLIGLRWWRMDAPERLVGAGFIGLGVVAAGPLPALWLRAGATPAALVLAGGLLHVIGAVGYHRRRPDPSPAVFGYHEVFHAYVCAAATCHFLAIALYVI